MLDILLFILKAVGYVLLFIVVLILSVVLICLAVVIVLFVIGFFNYIINDYNDPRYAPGDTVTAYWTHNAEDVDIHYDSRTESSMTLTFIDDKIDEPFHFFVSFPDRDLECAYIDGERIEPVNLVVNYALGVTTEVGILLPNIENKLTVTFVFKEEKLLLYDILRVTDYGVHQHHDFEELQGPLYRLHISLGKARRK